MTHDRHNDTRDVSEPVTGAGGDDGVIDAQPVAEGTWRAVRARPDPFGHRSEAANCERVMGRRRHGLGEQGRK